MAHTQHTLSMASLPRLAGWTPGVLMALALAACAQPVALSQRCDGRELAGPTQRVLVSFREATLADAPAVIDQLQALVGACVRPVASVSPQVHAYAVNTAADVAQIRARLLRWSAVTAVDADARVRPR